MTDALVYSNFESFLTSNTNSFIKDAGYWARMGDDGGFKFGQYVFKTSETVANLVGNETAAARSADISAGFDGVRGGIGAIRVLFAAPLFFTGQKFWETNASGWRRVLYNENGAPVQINPSELGTIWKKQTDGTWHCPQTGQKSSDGKYIEDPTGGYLSCNWMDIAMNVLIMTARILSPIRWLHNMKAYDLGQHAQNMGKVVMGIWGVVLTMNLVESVQGLLEEVDLEKVRQRCGDLGLAVLGWVSLPFDFGIGSAHPALACVGAVLNLLDAGAFMFREIMYYG